MYKEIGIDVQRWSYKFTSYIVVYENYVVQCEQMHSSSVSKCTIQCEQMHSDDFLLVTLAAGFHSLNLISS